MIDLYSSATPNGRKITIMLEELGIKYKFLSIVLEAPFTSVPDIAQKRYKIFPTKYLVLDNSFRYSFLLKLFFSNEALSFR